MGAYFGSKLATLASHPLVGDVRSKGLLAGIELVTDKAAKTRPAPELGLPGHLDRIGYENRLIFRAFGAGKVGLAPPLFLTRDDIALLLGRLVRTLTALLEQN